MILRIYDGPFYGVAGSTTEPEQIRCEPFENNREGIAKLLEYLDSFQDGYLSVVDFEDAKLKVRECLAPQIFTRQLRWAFNEGKRVCLYNSDNNRRWILNSGEESFLLVTEDGKKYVCPNTILSENGGIVVKQTTRGDFMSNTIILLRTNFVNPFTLKMITQDTLYFVSGYYMNFSNDSSVVHTEWL